MSYLSTKRILVELLFVTWQTICFTRKRLPNTVWDLGQHRLELLFVTWQTLSFSRKCLPNTVWDLKATSLIFVCQITVTTLTWDHPWPKTTLDIKLNIFGYYQFIYNKQTCYVVPCAPSLTMFLKRETVESKVGWLIRLNSHRLTRCRSRFLVSFLSAMSFACSSTKALQAKGSWKSDI